LGLDFTALEMRSGYLIGGVYVQYGHAKADVSSGYGYCDIKTDAHSFGSTLTWYQDNSFYVDEQAQVQWFQSGIYSRSRNREKGFDRYLETGNRGTDYAFGVEAGRRFGIF